MSSSEQNHLTTTSTISTSTTNSDETSGAGLTPLTSNKIKIEKTATLSTETNQKTAKVSRCFGNRNTLCMPPNLLCFKVWLCYLLNTFILLLYCLNIFSIMKLIFTIQNKISFNHLNYL